MFSNTRNPFDTRPTAKPDTAGFLNALGDPQAADAYLEAMGKDASPPTTDAQEQELTPEELARLQAIQDRERARHELVEQRKREYLEWAEELDVRKGDPEQWVIDNFIFNQDGTVETKGDFSLLVDRGSFRFPKSLVRVNGHLGLGGLRIFSLDDLRGKKIVGDLRLNGCYVESIPDAIELVGKVTLNDNQTLLMQDARRKGYKIQVF